jgi:hypothetical protein
VVGFPTNHFVCLHAYVLRVKLPENDESGFRFWVGGLRRPGETRRDFGLPKYQGFSLHAYGSSSIKKEKTNITAEK